MVVLSSPWIAQRSTSFRPVLFKAFHLRALRTSTLQDILLPVVEKNCGLRPVRKGGIQLEVEWFPSGTDGQKVPVAYNHVQLFRLWVTYCVHL